MAEEIIQIQIGNYSNFIGSHLWNTQHQMMQLYGSQTEKPIFFKSDVQFRTGYSDYLEKPTQNPRVMIFDERNRFGNLQKSGYQYHPNVSGKKISQYIDEMKRKVDGEVEVLVEPAEQTTKYMEFINQFKNDLEYSNEEESDGEDSDDLRISKVRKYSDVKQTSPEEESDINVEEIREDLEKNSKTWSDYLQCYIHPKSICDINTSLINGDELNSYSVGESLLSNENLVEEYTNKLHFFLEECDHIQGFQFITDIQDAWGGFGCRFLDIIRDEMGSKVPVYTYAVTDRSQNSFLDYNMSLSMADLYLNSSILVPLTEYQCTPDNFEYLSKLDPENRYHTSSLLAAAIDTCSMPMRHTSKLIEMIDFLSHLQPRASQRVSTLNISIPIPANKEDNLANIYRRLESPYYSPYISSLSLQQRSENIRPYASALTVRGLYPYKLYANKSSENFGLDEGSDLVTQIHQMLSKSNLIKPERKEKDHLDNCETHKEMLEKFFRPEQYYGSHMKVVKQPYMIPDTYPNIFHDNLNAGGYIEQGNEVQTTSMPILTNTQTTEAIVPYIKKLAATSKKLRMYNPEQFNRSKDDCDEINETLLQLADDYELDDEAV